ncbi:2378_t:CDS:10 [Diversispora eburnea]|uniref:2378_t:CDS:1 n=1 Tax=Diversispora eburnea TaxID=1213867 RepID=A0A9N9AAX3_9GLOM|nr:2378_t:CDS:10 [Diversispora eburnea]
MKFGKTLQAEAVLEWTTQYVDYKGLKGKLKAVKKSRYNDEIGSSSATLRNSNEIQSINTKEDNVPRRFSASSQYALSMAESTGSFFDKVSTKLVGWKSNRASFTPSKHKPPPTVLTSLEQLIEQSNPAEHAFFSALNLEITKTTLFYELKEKEAMNRLENLKVKDARKRIKKALFELYRGAELLRNYRNLNRLAFIKILKKFDKIRNSNAKGSRRRAVKKLRTPYKTNETHYSSVWRVGLCLGIAIPLFLYVISLALAKSQIIYLRFANLVDKSNPSNDTLDSIINPKKLERIKDLEYNRTNLLIIYSGIGLIIKLTLLTGLNMYVWSQARINYKLIFGFNPRDNLDYKQYMEIPSLIFLIFCVTMFLNFENPNLFKIGVANYSRVMLALIIFIIVMPFKIFYYSARRWFTLTTLRIFGAPFTSVKFREFFITDELTSLSYSLVTLLILTCDCSGDEKRCDTQVCNSHLSYYAPFLASIPALLRALQCTRRFYDTHKSVHLTNFGKYMSVISSIWMLFLYRRSGNKYKTFWIVSQSIYSLYTSYWDVCMDWQLFQKNNLNPFLREHLAFKKKRFYYFAIISNCILRWSWTLILFANKNSINIIIFVIAFGEIRWQWNFIRVEHEHTLNCRDFRAINDIQLPFGSSHPSDKIIGNDLSGIIIDDSNTATPVRKSFKTNIQNFFTQMRSSRNVQTEEYAKHNYVEKYVNEYDEEEGSDEYDYEEYDYEETDYDENDYEENDRDGVRGIYVIGNEKYPTYPRINYERNFAPSSIIHGVGILKKQIISRKKPRKEKTKAGT